MSFNKSYLSFCFRPPREYEDRNLKKDISNNKMNCTLCILLYLEYLLLSSLRALWTWGSPFLEI